MRYVRQRTDIIHGTIYLSELESELSSTPFFYRLHDIYQSSTVYFTFPSNRTKRYEHSLGTMALASEILFSGITNATTSVRDAFFEKLNSEFEVLYRKILRKDYPNSYLGDNKGVVVNFVSKSERDKDVEELSSHDLERAIDKDIDCVLTRGLLSDNALNHFSLHTTKNDSTPAPSSSQPKYVVSGMRQRFLYQCILQAVRLVALFHDVGHPPYSHIIENVLCELYEECTTGLLSESIDENKIQKLNESLGRFIPDKNSKSELPLEFDFLSLKQSAPSSQLHEQVGIHMFRMAIESIMPDILHKIRANSSQIWTNKAKMTAVLYYVAVVEFAAAILLEKNDFFRSLHRIVDGTIDADRLDYVVRDAHNSGVDWGSIPYNRIIDSAKLLFLRADGSVAKDTQLKGTNLFAIGYPRKVSSDIEDFLLNRHKIFVRINYHHRCTKTSTALQSAVKILAKDYLSCPSSPSARISEPGLQCIEEEIVRATGDDEDQDIGLSDPICISNTIHILWTALGSTNGDEALKVLQWNDSWLISTLQSALLKIRTEKNFERRILLQAVRQGWQKKSSESHWSALNLEEKKQFLRDIWQKKQSDLTELKKNLEEFLLNKKAYYSLFKRGIDVRDFIAQILSYAELDRNALKEQLEKEKSAYYYWLHQNPEPSTLSDCLDNPATINRDNAKDAVTRLENFLKACEVGDLKGLTTLLPEQYSSTNEIIEEVLTDAQTKERVVDFKLYLNPAWNKNGLPNEDTDYTKQIYLYDGDTVIAYDSKLLLRSQLNAIRQDMLWLYAYIMPAPECEDIGALLSDLRSNCAKKIGELLKKRYDELFPNHS